MSLTEAREREARGDLQGAAKAYERALARSSSHLEQGSILIALGTCLLDKDLDEAEERIAQARTVAEGAGDETLLGEVELLEGRLAQARGSHRLAHSKLLAASEKLRTDAGSPRIDVLIRLASAERSRGELNSANECLKRIDPADLEADLDAQAEYKDELGAILLAQGDFRSAISVLTEALQLDSRVDPHSYRGGRSRLLLAEALMESGDRVRSKRLILEAKESFEHADTGLSEACALLGRWYEEDGDFNAATRCYREGLNIDHDSDDDLGEVRALRRLARVARKRGDHDQAAEQLERARSLLAGSEDDVEIAALMTEEGYLAIEMSDYDRAVARFQEALRKIEEDGEQRAIAVAKRNLAQAIWETGDLARAEQLLLEARPVLEDRGDLKELDDLLDDLGEVLLERGHFADAVECITRSIQIDESLDYRISRARSYLLLGRAHLETGDQERALSCTKNALDIYEEAEDDVGRSDALFHLGECQMAIGATRDALKSFRTALSLDSKHNDAVGVARAQRGMAGIFRRRGSLTRAQELIDDATTELSRISDRAERAHLWVEAGRLALERGDHHSAERFLRDAIKSFQDLDCPQRVATGMRLMARVLASRGDCASALELLERARRSAEELGLNPELDQIFDELGLVYLQMNSLNEARTSVERSLELGRRMGWSRGNGRSLLILGQIESRLENYVEARRNYLDAKSAYEEVEDEVGVGNAWELLGDLAAKERDYEGAIKAFKAARQIQQSHGDTRGLARTFRKLGEVYFNRREYQRAEEAFEQAEDHLRLMDDAKERGHLYLARGNLAVASGEHKQGVRHFERALPYFRERQEKEKTTEVYRQLAASHQALGNYEEAMSYMRAMGLEQASLWTSLLASLHPELHDVVAPKYLVGEHTDAVLAAFALLEQAFVERTPNSTQKSVSARISEWVTVECRGLSPFRDEEALRAFKGFCINSFGILRNAAAHKWREFNSVDAFAAFGVAHLIATLIDSPETTRQLVVSPQRAAASG